MLDSGANICVFRNADLISNLQQLDQPIEIEGVGGISSHSQEGRHPIFGRVIHNPDMRFNAVSMSVMRAKGYTTRRFTLLDAMDFAELPSSRIRWTISISARAG
jgi:hypothetical protein